MTTKKVVLIRHGETAWSLSGQHTGLTDIPLTDNGIKQAQLLSKALVSFSFSHAFVSPLQRAYKTFTLSGLTTPFTLDPLLVEWNYGDYEGMTSDAIHQKDPGWNIFINGAPNGESIDDIEKRASLVIEKVLSTEGDIAIFSSGHILRCIAAKWLGMPVDFGKHLCLQTASISILSYEHQFPTLCQWNSGVCI